MEMIQDFIEILDFNANDSCILATIKLNKNHVVYKAHFPGFPVTPGVIQMYIVQQLFEKYSGYKIRLFESGNCKFLKIINPNEMSELLIEIKIKTVDNLISLAAVGKSMDVVCFKIDGYYIKF